MSKNYEEMLDFLDYDGAEALFSQREKNFDRIPFEVEQKMYDLIQEGQPDELISFGRSYLLQTPNFKVSVGQTSLNKLRQMKYAAVSAVAMACRSAIQGGLPESVAYGKSDDTILMIDNAESVAAILKIEVSTLLEYAKLVQQTKHNANYSPAVRFCIDYITSHSHKNITLDELAENSVYSNEYLAKLFKKETGKTLRDYIFQVRINEAKFLLASGKSCGEVSYLMGFSSQSHFINRFKEATGYTPRFYAKLYKK